MIAATFWRKEIYVTPLYTRMRIGELANMDWEDVDFAGRKIQ